VLYDSSQIDQLLSRELTRAKLLININITFTKDKKKFLIRKEEKKKAAVDTGSF
jgi:hypothetical protein